MLQDMINRIRNYKPDSRLDSADFKEAAVLMPIIKKTEPELLLTLRANYLSTHSGEVAFPGGKREPAEEIALPAHHIEVIGSLEPLVSKYKIKVTPFIALVDDAIHYQPNLQEVAAIFTVPLAFFKAEPQVITHRIDYLNRDWYVPCYNYQGYKIWGLTAIMIAELMSIIAGNMPLAPEKCY